MGIASSLAQPGDLVCWVAGVERALILRVSQVKESYGEYTQTFQIFGTALFTNDFGSDGKAHHSGQRLQFEKEENLMLQMDAETIYVLLA